MALSDLIRVIKNKWITPPLDVEESYAGRNVIVTGSTSGIGLEAAVKFVSKGANKVIITARDMGKGEAVKADIEARTGKKDVLELWELDMDSYDSVLAFADRANALDHLDIAVLNAGLRENAFELSKYGWEVDLQVNTLSTVLLGILLLPKLKGSRRADSKIPILEFTSSGLHQSAKIAPEALDSDSIIGAYNVPERFGPGSQYAISKLFLMYATNKLAAETSSGDVIVTSICPGMVQTDLAREVQIPGKAILMAIFGFIMLKTPEQGARMIVSGTTQGESVHGRFWQADEIKPIGPSVAGEENRKIALRVWNEIIEALSKDVPAVKETLRSIVKE